MAQALGTIHGVGLGPGAQDLLSVRADRLVRNAKHVAFFRKAGRPGQARTIVNGMLADNAIEFPMEYPVTTEIPLTDSRYNEIPRAFYATCTDHLRTLAEQGEDVVVLCEGDPFFYGSFMYLHARLAPRFTAEIVPGVTSVTACAAVAGRPLVARNERLTVLPGPLPDAAQRAEMLRFFQSL